MEQNTELDLLLSTSGGGWQVESQSGGAAGTQPERRAQSRELGHLAQGGLVYVCEELGAGAGWGGLNGGGCHFWSLMFVTQGLENMLDDLLFHKEMPSPTLQSREQGKYLSPLP